MDTLPDYVSYLLRLWKSVEDKQVFWHANLECTQDGKILNFDSIYQLAAYLTSHFGQKSEREQNLTHQN